MVSERVRRASSWFLRSRRSSSMSKQRVSRPLSPCSPSLRSLLEWVRVSIRSLVGGVEQHRLDERFHRIHFREWVSISFRR